MPAAAGRPTAAPPDRAAAARPLWQRAEDWMRRSPPLTASLSLHVLVLLILALIVIREPQPKRLTLEMTFAGDQPGADPGGAVVVAPVEEAAVEEPATKEEPLAAASPADVAAVEPPPTPADNRPALVDDKTAPTALAAVEPRIVLPQEEPIAPSGGNGSAAVAPAVAGLLEGRSAARKEALLTGGGGTAETEAAVTKALEWLVRNQGRDGLWSLQGPYADGANQENRLAATAMALLAFQGAGHTTRDGKHAGTVSRGWKALLKTQSPDGVFDLGRIPDQHAMYAHAQATIAICELYGMTRDAAVRPAAQRAIDYAVAAQMPDGGWRYRPPQPNGDTKGDMSVSGWFMMALKSAEMASLDVPAATYVQLEAFLDGVLISDDKGYGYQIIPGQKVVQVRPALTAEALLCRQYLGWRQDDPRLVAGVDLLFRELPLDFEYPHKNVYAWYYATQVCHHMGGVAWERWNGRLRAVVPAHQVSSGKDAGSWDPALDQWGHIGGRLFVTCMCTAMLEVYYRHLPLCASP